VVHGLLQISFAWKSSMTTVAHESFDQAVVKPPSDRSTGIVFACVALVVAILWRNTPAVLWWSLGISAVLALISLVVPSVLRPLNLVWFRFGLLLHRVMNPLIMFLMFALVFVPGGLLMRIWHDPLGARRKGAASYWVERERGKSISSMSNQF
jgi:hypothetical protein